jgi:hypothetical protein
MATKISGTEDRSRAVTAAVAVLTRPELESPVIPWLSASDKKSLWVQRVKLKRWVAEGDLCRM